MPVVHGLNLNINDAENDVIRNCGTGDDTGDYYDEIDIVKLIISGRNVNVTIAGSLAKWNLSHYGSVIFSEWFRAVSAPSYFAYNVPYYAIDYDNDIGSMVAKLEKGYPLNDEGYAYEVWNGTAWEDRFDMVGSPFNIVDTVTNHSITFYIPDAVEELPSNMKAVVSNRFSKIFGNCDFIDFTPLPSDHGINSDQWISSYDIFVLICTMIGISFIIIKNYKTQNP
ncbi:MAG: hypothetical protein ACFFCE_06620 [Promethearchaeota archaeon]